MFMWAVFWGAAIDEHRFFTKPQYSTDGRVTDGPRLLTERTPDTVLEITVGLPFMLDRSSIRDHDEIAKLVASSTVNFRVLGEFGGFI